MTEPKITRHGDTMHEHAVPDPFAGKTREENRALLEQVAVPTLMDFRRQYATDIAVAADNHTHPDGVTVLNMLKLLETPGLYNWQYQNALIEFGMAIQRLRTTQFAAANWASGKKVREAGATARKPDVLPEVRYQAVLSELDRLESAGRPRNIDQACRNLEKRGGLGSASILRKTYFAQRKAHCK